MSRPTDLQNLWQHFHILKFKKSLRGAHYIYLACQGRPAPLPPPVSYATAHGVIYWYYGCD